MRQKNYQLLSAASLGASFNSDPIPMEQFHLLGLQLAISGAAALNGSVKLQGSCDLGANPTGVASEVTGLTNWTDISGTTQALTADGTFLYNLADLGCTWVRLVYTFTAGTGSLSARAVCKSYA